MAMAGNLALKPDEVNCYENFSCAYFSRIMTAYRSWSAQAFQQLKLEDPPPMKVYTEKELDNLHRGDVEAFYQRCRNGVIPHSNYLPQYFKDILVKDGLMKPEDHLEVFFQNRLGKGIEKIYEKVDPGQ